jgi:pyruvate kinase
MRKTKIICTLGPASDSYETIEQLVDAGMDVARFNFSHNTHEGHKKTLELLRKVSREKGVPVAALLDTKGPELRLGSFGGERFVLEEGQTFTLTSQEIMGTKDAATISYKKLPGDMSPGDRILLDDGLIELRVISTDETEIVCEVLNGGEISDHKGVNVPGVEISMPYLSAQDIADIEFGVEAGFDFIAASFVTTARDVLEIRSILKRKSRENVLIIAKIENAQGVRNIEEILQVADGIMIARGDMGVEIDFELLPGIQKMLIKQCYQSGKMVITATQMLESMIHNPRPTRAEISDVANAVYDGTSAIMLSGETAAGKYPVKAVGVMAKIAETTESKIQYQRRFENSKYAEDKKNITNAISHATCTTAYDLHAACIITVTMSGRNARNISKYRPGVPVLACTPSESTYRQLALSWGVTPVLTQEAYELDGLFDMAEKAGCDAGLLTRGDIAIISVGVPLGVTGSTNLLKVHMIEDKD